MIHLHYSNRLENLIAPLAAAIAQHQLQWPLRPVPIVVPNRVEEQFVKLRLSEALGVAANLKFPFLRRSLGEIVEAASPGVRILEAEGLQAVIFECLRGLRRSGGGALRAAQIYAETGAQSEADYELRLFQLSDRLARLMREYSITRRPMLAAWRRGPQLERPPFDEAQSWQRELWLRLFAADGSLNSEWTAEDSPRQMLLPDGFDAVSDEQLRMVLPPALHIFGLAYAGPAFAQMFARIGKLTAVHLYALNPCMEFWEDLDHPAGIARESWIGRGQRLGGVDGSPDPFGLDMAGDNPALRLWGRPGREYVRLLNELTDCDFDAHFARPTTPPAPTLLQRIQESILIREPERQTSAQPTQDDGSIRFLACPGIRREAEIVANRIWSLMRQDRAVPLRFHQIAVIFPDRAQDDYLPHIESVFAELHAIPLNFVNRRLATESRVAEAVELLLRLPLGRFTRNEMLRLLTHPAICGRDATLDSERWPQWCNAIGVFFGADQQDLSGTYLPRDLFHWDQALKRLALGLFMSGGRGDEARFFATPDETEYLPFEVAQDEAPGISALVRLARNMIADATEFRSLRLTLAQWGGLLSRMILTYVQAPEAVDERIRDYCVSAIESIAAAGIRSEPVPFEIAFDSAAARIREVELRRGQYAESGVAAGGLSALRSIPFRVIFLLGMNENDFPERTRHDPLDLRLAQRRAGDVTPADRDRYLFLETLLAAREQLFISYIAREQQTGDLLEPAAVVRELQFVLRGYVDSGTLESMTKTHPMSRYDPRYFGEFAEPGAADPELVSFDSKARRAARMTSLRRDLERQFGVRAVAQLGQPLLDCLSADVREELRRDLRAFDWTAPSGTRRATAEELSLPLAALRKFLECPLQGAARYALGMTEDDEDGGDEGRDEPLAQALLDRAIMLRAALRRGLGDRAAATREYRDAFRIAQVRGRAPVGAFAEAATAGDLALLEDWTSQIEEAGVNDFAQWWNIRIGSAGEFEQADRLVPEIVLEVPIALAGGGSRRLRIHGSAGIMSPRMDASIQFAMHAEPFARDFLALIFPAIALVAAGEKLPTEFKAIVAGPAAEKAQRRSRTFKLPTAEQAREYLRVIASDLLANDCHYFLPIEAVEAAYKVIVNGGAGVLERVEQVRENDRLSCRSDFGPVPNARSFAPPPEDEIRRVIQRRFGPILGIFGR